MAAAAPRRRSAPLAALALAALILYASLYPFEGWRWPPGSQFGDMLALPWPRWRPMFDIWANLLGYLPLGLLVTLAVGRRGPAFWLGLGLPTLLSYGAEVAQHFLPGRHPSLLDLALNSAGAGVGALIGRAMQALGWVEHWRAWRARWFERESATALLLLGLWPIGLLFPAPVALGLGQVGQRLRPWLFDLVDGVPWAASWQAALAPRTLSQAPLTPLIEMGITLLGLLSPCLVAFAVATPGWRRVVWVAGALGLAVGVVTLSTALSFGPDHALAWWSATTTPALVGGTLLALALAFVPRRLTPGLGLMALTALVLLVAQAPNDPYYAQSLQSWEQGRFIHLHGVAQWVGWLWPYAALLWLLTRLGSVSGQTLESGR